ncbi:MAG: UDP-2,3-diacylglucosamine diphosphatase LpxI [Acidobacteria bacterium]|nr:UDP-2,3-diacylglucosamine diphosphatase LpxI [Acidobacteriota bacterium]
MSSSPSGGRLGLICGGTDLPQFVLSEALQHGENPVVIAILEETDASLEDLAKDFYWLEIGNIGKAIEIFKNSNVDRCLMVGRVDHRRIFRNINFDKNIEKVYLTLKDRRADSLLSAFVQLFEDNGIRFLDSTLFLKDKMAPLGLIGKTQPDELIRKEILFGWELAKAIGKHDIGQSVMVRERAVVGVEAIEGTDELIKRSKDLCPSMAVLVKVAKPNQDPRFDVPVIGPSTIENLAAVKAAALAVEAGKTIIIDIEKSKELADINNIVFIGINEEYAGNK